MILIIFTPKNDSIKEGKKISTKKLAATIEKQSILAFLNELNDVKIPNIKITKI